MQKMEYCRPAADLILFENEDVIMTSGKPGEGGKPEGLCPNNGTHWHCIVFMGSWCDKERCETGVWEFWHDVFPDAPYSLDDDQYSGTEAFDNTEDFDDFGEWRD